MKLKTDLLNPKNFNRSQSELEEFLLLCIFVAGKSSKTQYHKLELFLDELDVTNGIFKALSLLSIEEIKEKLIKVKSGQYSRLCGCLFILSRKNLDLSKCSCEDLEAIPGIGMKTSRFFITYSRPTNSYAILDTHILAWLKNYYPQTPKATPSNKKEYLKYEQFFLSECLKRNLAPQELDLQIWKERQKSWKV
jgi:thermostable 8-oxoguanine DNA glycosylase